MARKCKSCNMKTVKKQYKCESRRDYSSSDYSTSDSSYYTSDSDTNCNNYCNKLQSRKTPRKNNRLRKTSHNTTLKKKLNRRTRSPSTSCSCSSCDINSDGCCGYQAKMVTAGPKKAKKIKTKDKAK